MDYWKTKVFIKIALLCVICLMLIYLVHTVYVVSVLGYGHIGQLAGGYFLVGANYYKPLDTPSDVMSDEEELAMIDADKQAENEPAPAVQ